MSIGAILFYLLVGLVIVSLVLAVRTIRGRPEHSGKSTSAKPPIEQPDLKLVDFFPECSGLDSQWTYKSKIRLYLRNETENEMFVENLAWTSAAFGVPAQGPIGRKFQIEGPNGWEAESWLEERDTVHVPPGIVFRVWIGLWLDPNIDPNLRSADLRRRAIRKSLGTVTLTIRQRETPTYWRLNI